MRSESRASRVQVSSSRRPLAASRAGTWYRRSTAHQPCPEHTLHRSVVRRFRSAPGLRLEPMEPVTDDELSASFLAINPARAQLSLTAAKWVSIRASNTRARGPTCDGRNLGLCNVNRV